MLGLGLNIEWGWPVCWIWLWLFTLWSLQLCIAELSLRSCFWTALPLGVPRRFCGILVDFRAAFARRLPAIVTLALLKSFA